MTQQSIGNFRFDTPPQIFRAALIAEDLATTFYYNGLVGGAIQDPSLAGPGGTSAATDPIQNFYPPTGSFDTAPAFLALLDTLEKAFIGAYLLAVKSFAYMSALLNGNSVAGYMLNGAAYNSSQVQYYGEVAASILGVEAEHCVLGRVISNSNPANNYCYEQNDGLDAMYNGPSSAVAALTPFLAPGKGLTEYSFAEALKNQASVSLPCSGGPPPA